MKQLIPQRRTIHTFPQTQLAFYVEYNCHLFKLWRNGRADSVAFQMCRRRVNDLRERIPGAARTGDASFLDRQLFFSDNGSGNYLFLISQVHKVLSQEVTHVSD